ncbi:FecR family protein [Arachidicoccus terrestris]|uniref:FecR family protein n=1 Tax=Arachidicoccus terrestris TaxID=2875539 RepID=UPI001CC4B6FF|nr:FecR domain-containing protein [Arachidicoccus terrestris]UAY55649.1 DUF4974 domain-containing protein [Arachidicoccus terrestris]
MTPIETNIFIDLVERYTTGQFLTEQELDLLERGMRDADCLKALDEKMSLELESGPDDKEDAVSVSFQEEALARFREKLKSATDREAARQNTLDKESSVVDSHHRPFQAKMMVAALIGVVLIIVGMAIFQLKKKGGGTDLADSREKYHRTVPIVPGSSGAILTLGNGRKIALGNPHKGLIHIGSLTIEQNKDAAKFSNSVLENGKVLYNTLTTPRGRQFQVELPDGTDVWLNASSSLKFPTIFNKENRTVELRGEAYFEVEHNADHPFQVRVNGQLIEDIGTKFNVKAYSDDPVMLTALVEGTVDVSNGLKRLRLAPGQQVSIRGERMAVSKADLNQILSWKSGFFAFRNANIEEIMRQLSRWYDVDIRYANARHGKQEDAQRYTGRIDRNLDLQDLLDGLQFSQMHFKIDKNKRTIVIEN